MDDSNLKFSPSTLPDSHCAQIRSSGAGPWQSINGWQYCWQQLQAFHSGQAGSTTSGVKFLVQQEHKEVLAEVPDVYFLAKSPKVQLLLAKQTLPFSAIFFSKKGSFDFPIAQKGCSHSQEWSLSGSSGISACQKYEISICLFG